VGGGGVGRWGGGGGVVWGGGVWGGGAASRVGEGKDKCRRDWGLVLEEVGLDCVHELCAYSRTVCMSCVHIVQVECLQPLSSLPSSLGGMEASTIA